MGKEGHSSRYAVSSPKGGRDEVRLDGVPTAIPDSRTPAPVNMSEDLFALSVDCLLVAGLSSGRVHRANHAAEALLGWTEAELGTHAFTEGLLHPEDVDSAREALSRLQMGLPVRDLHNRWRTKSGEYRWLSWRAEPRRSRQLFVATGRDVTAERQPASVETSLTTIAGRLRDLEETLTREPTGPQPQTPTSAALQRVVDEAERKLTPWGKAWRILAAVAGVVLTAVVAVFGAGRAYEAWTGSNATKDDVRAQMAEFDKKTVEPLRKDVKEVAERTEEVSARTEVMEQSLAPIKQGVQDLVEQDRRTREVEAARSLLAKHQQEYELSMAAYTADRAAGRRVGRPRKTPAHLALEKRVETLEAELYGR